MRLTALKGRPQQCFTTQNPDAIDLAMRRLAAVRIELERPFKQAIVRPFLLLP
jgi:hypothetical protein